MIPYFVLHVLCKMPKQDLSLLGVLKGALVPLCACFVAIKRLDLSL